MSKIWKVIDLVGDCVLLLCAVIAIVFGEGTFEDYFIAIGMIIFGIIDLLRKKRQKEY